MHPPNNRYPEIKIKVSKNALIKVTPMEEIYLPSEKGENINDRWNRLAQLLFMQPDFDKKGLKGNVRVVKDAYSKILKNVSAKMG